ncbi:galactokinase family protein, partial [Oenococcus oeni]
METLDKNSLLKEFKEQFKKTAEKVFFSPGRINLIGEHTDYNGGNVFPCAISIGTFGVYGSRDDQTIRMYSANIPDQGVVSFQLNDLEYHKEDGWTNYLRGVLASLVSRDYKINHGFDLFIHGNLPDGAGLSSSASIELLMGTILKNVFSLD